MTEIISVENISKKYVIRTRTPESYATLRETLSGKAMSLIRKSPPGRTGERADFWALKGVHFRVNEGDRVGIVGRNGAGKSTLLKILSRVTEPTEGRIRIRGRVASLLEVGTGFHAELTGRENIYLNGAVLGMRKAEIAKKFDEIVAFSGVGQFIDTPVKRYSSGMYVRLAFSIAAHIDPDVLIVDEVLAVGDLEFQQRCLSRMRALETAGRTVLFVTHNMDAMMALCNRGIVLNGGRIVFDGSAAEGKSTYIALQTSQPYSVAEHSGRGGSALARVLAVTVEASKAGQAIAAGDGISVAVSFSGSESLPADAPLDLGIGIDTVDGMRLFTSLSSWQGVTYNADSCERKAFCEIAALPLVSGTYLISVALIYRGETLDAVRHCASFNVVTRGDDVYKHRLEGFGSLDIACRFR